jgi:imidazolonepropionase-like amidohydrolase
VEVDGPYEVRRAAREQLRQGADWIKVMITGGSPPRPRRCMRPR